MGGRGSSSGGSDLGGGGGSNINVKSTEDLITQRGNNQQFVDQTLSVLRDVNELYGYVINDAVVADIGNSNTMAYYEEGTATLGVNQKYFDVAKMNAAYERTVRSGFHPSNGSYTGTEAVMAHEAGHALTEQAAKNQNIGFEAMARKIVSESLNAKNGTQARKVAGQISGYAKTSNSECIAEAFADVYCNGRNAKQESQNVVSALNKYLRG